MNLPQISLSKVTDSEMNAAVAEHVGGLRPIKVPPDSHNPYGEFQHTWWLRPGAEAGDTRHSITLPDYLHDSYAVVILLSRESCCDIHGGHVKWTVTIHVPLGRMARGEAPSFCRAACVALLKASGKVEVIP